MWNWIVFFVNDKYRGIAPFGRKGSRCVSFCRCAEKFLSRTLVHGHFVGPLCLSISSSSNFGSKVSSSLGKDRLCGIAASSFGWPHRTCPQASPKLVCLGVLAKIGKTMGNCAEL